VKIRPLVFPVGDDKKREGNERKGITQFRVIYLFNMKILYFIYYYILIFHFSAILGADHLGPISTKISGVKGAHDVIILSNFGFIIFRGFRSTAGQNLHLPIDFAGRRYNIAAATAQPVIYMHYETVP